MVYQLPEHFNKEHLTMGYVLILQSMRATILMVRQERSRITQVLAQFEDALEHSARNLEKKMTE